MLIPTMIFRQPLLFLLNYITIIRPPRKHIGMFTQINWIAAKGIFRMGIVRVKVMNNLDKLTVS